MLEIQGFKMAIITCIVLFMIATSAAAEESKVGKIWRSHDEMLCEGETSKDVIILICMAINCIIYVKSWNI